MRPGEGETFQPTTAPATVTTDASGDVSFSFPFVNPVPPGKYITATATDPNGNTPEFSACSLVQAAPNGAPVNHMPGAQVTKIPVIEDEEQIRIEVMD